MGEISEPDQGTTEPMVASGFGPGEPGYCEAMTQSL